MELFVNGEICEWRKIRKWKSCRWETMSSFDDRGKWAWGWRMWCRFFLERYALRDWIDGFQVEDILDQDVCVDCCSVQHVRYAS